jgi:hypothetical protein
MLAYGEALAGTGKPLVSAGSIGSPGNGGNLGRPATDGPERDGPIPELDSKSLTSSELLLIYIPDALLVKAFNNIFFKHLLSLARPVARLPSGVVRRSQPY